MIAYLDFLFLSYQGRIGRGAYWLGFFGLGFAELGAIGFLLHLSHSSVADLLAFYRTPLGQKMLVEQPKIFTELLPLAQAWGRVAGAQAVQAALQSLRQEGVKI